MIHKIVRVIAIIFLLSIVLQVTELGAQNWEDVSVIMFMDGRLIWTTHNFGRTCGYPAWDTFYWPVNTHHYKSQHAITGSFMFAVEDNVIESYSAEHTPDWMPYENSLGYYHASNQEEGLKINLIYPQMASSVEPRSWPRRSASNPSIVDPNGEPWWPGRMIPGASENDRWNITAPFAASDKEAFCVFSDQYNIGAPPLGIEVQEQIYTYTRNYASDMAFIDFLIINTSNKDINGAYIGYHLYPYIPGGGVYDDYLAAYDTDIDRDDKPDVIACYDPKDDKLFEADEHSDWPHHWFGLMVLKTPLTTAQESEIDDMGVTDFHFFFAPGPVTNQAQWPVISSDTSDSDLDAPVSFYFHDTGPDNRIDNTDWIATNKADGADWAFYIMSGPVDLPAGDSTVFTIGFTAGVGEDQFLRNVSQAQLMAQRNFMGPGAPPPPKLTAVPGDRKITLYWEDTAEHAKDPFTGEEDFEGYKIYRLSKGPFGTNDWGQEITNMNGDIVGYVPLAQFDIIDGIVGMDSLNQYQNLGMDTGLRHTYEDTTVVNGVPYTYCITVYDKGDPKNDLPSYESGRSIAGTSRFVASAIAGSPATGLVPGAVIDSILFINPADTSFYVNVDVIDPDAVVGHDYQITFSDFTDLAGVLAYRQGFNLYDVTTSQFLIKNGILTDPSRGGDNTPFSSGFRLKFVGRSASSDYEKIWMKPTTAEDGARLPYWFAKRYLDDLDLEFTIDVNNPVTIASYRNYGTATYQVPIRVKNLRTDEDLTPYMQVADEAFKHPNSADYNSISYPVGNWDLTPGGACWNPIIDTLLVTQNFDRAIESADRIYGLDATGKVLFKLYTIHPPDGATPSTGDKFYLGTQKPFPRDAFVQFSTRQAFTDEKQITSRALEAVRVVPNPYVVSEAWDIYNRMGKIMFTHLPEICDIRVYTIAGDLIKTIKHRGTRIPGVTVGSTHAEDLTRAGRGFEEWDLTTDNQLGIAFGLYVYVVETPNGEKKIGKFAIIK